MFFVYVIKSLAHDFLYKGHCQDLEKRLAQHNQGLTISTRKYAPFKVVYFVECDTRYKAIEREKYFKTAAGRRYLKKKLAL
jgi:putative endonuclease